MGKVGVEKGEKRKRKAGEVDVPEIRINTFSHGARSISITKLVEMQISK